MVFVLPFLHHGQCDPVDNSSRLSSLTQKRFAKRRGGFNPFFFPAFLPLPRLFPQAAIHFCFFSIPLLSRHQHGTTANPLQYPSRLFLREAPADRKIRSIIRPAFPFQQKIFPSSTRHDSKPVAISVPTFPPKSSSKPQNPVDNSSRLSFSAKNFPTINTARQQTSCNIRPDFSSEEHPQTAKSGR